MMANLGGMPSALPVEGGSFHPAILTEYGVDCLTLLEGRQEP